VPLERVSQGFRDVSMSFKTNPLTNDLIAIKNENAIARSIKNIVFTLPGEKFFDENFGSRISKLLFDNMDDLTASSIKDEIERSIRNNEPRVRLRSVKTLPNFENHEFDVTITYDIIGADVPAQQLEFVLQPTR
jgi:phage baseplate assembly protein W